MDQEAIGYLKQTLFFLLHKIQILNLNNSTNHRKPFNLILGINEFMMTAY